MKPEAYSLRSKEYKREVRDYLLKAVNAVIDKIIETTTIKFVPCICERCGAPTKELHISFIVEIARVIFSFKKRVTVKIFYHPLCGLSYVRFK